VVPIRFLAFHFFGSERKQKFQVLSLVPSEDLGVTLEVLVASSGTTTSSFFV
jgi:hypothetical protein